MNIARPLPSDKASRLSQRFSLEQKEEGVRLLAAQAQTLPGVPFRESATQLVPGDGPLNARLMLIGEGPGRDEDLQGKPFVGRSGQLLTKTLAKTGFERSELYISNVVKYRPPNNRTPSDEETAFWSDFYLFKEIKIIRPEVIVALGSSAAKALLGKETRLGAAKGKEFALGPITLIPTYHPAYILRNPSALEELERALYLARKVINNFCS